MASDQRLLSLVEKIYDAALDPRLWPDFLEALRTVGGGSAAVLTIHDFSACADSVSASVGVDSVATRQYDEYYGSRNILMNRNPHLLLPGRVLSDAELCPVDEFLASEYYNDYLRPQNIRYLTGGSILQQDAIAAVITLIRPHSANGFSSTEQRLIQQLMPHLQRAVRMHRRLNSANAACSAFSETLNHLAAGVIVTDGAGNLLLVNKAAESMLAAKDGLLLRARKLHLQNARIEAQLQLLITQAATRSDSKVMQSGGLLVLPRPSMRRGYVLQVCPLPQNEVTMLNSGTGAALVLISDPEAQPQPDMVLLRQAFGLTSAESRLVSKLMAGKSLSEAAESLCITRNTANSQLKSIFSKTGTRRQSGLIRLLFLTATQLRSQSEP